MSENALAVQEKGRLYDLAALDPQLALQRQEVAKGLFSSGLFPNVRNPWGAYAVVQYGGEIGLGPMVALQSINIISGKLACNGQVMLAIATARGVEYDVEEETNEKCVILFKKGKLKYRSSFSLEEARKIVVKGDGKTMSLADKDNWKNYPRDMLFWRTIARGVRRVDPAGTMGLYTPDELTGGDIIDVSEFKEVPPGRHDPVPMAADDHSSDPKPNQVPKPEVVEGEFTTSSPQEFTQEEKWEAEYRTAMTDIDAIRTANALYEWGQRHGKTVDPKNPRLEEIRRHFGARLQQLKNPPEGGEG